PGPSAPRAGPPRAAQPGQLPLRRRRAGRGRGLPGPRGPGGRGPAAARVRVRHRATHLRRLAGGERAAPHGPGRGPGAAAAVSGPAPSRPRGLVIAIDGPSGAGKSTAGRALAARLGYLFLDTGAMYRALALQALRGGVALQDGEALAGLARRCRIDLAPGGEGVRLDGEDVTAAIRTREVSAAASRVSVHGAVRREMVARQREMGRGGGVVLDGRDIG